jgi:drug/metabolite transporter (DMT)-like permease
MLLDINQIKTLFIFNQSDLILLLILGSVCTAYAHVGSVKVMRNLSPFSFMIIINLEPVYAVVLSLIFFGKNELMSIDFYIGFSLILIAIFLDSLDKRNTRMKKLTEKKLHL